MPQDIQLTFIKKSLDEYAQMVSDTMRQRMQKMKTIDTKQLFNSLRWRAHAYEAEGNLEFIFSEHGRFLDMGVTRGRPLSGIRGTSLALGAKHAKFKARQIYSPVAYGKLNWLIGELAYGFTQETKQQLINNIQ